MSDRQRIDAISSSHELTPISEASQRPGPSQIAADAQPLQIGRAHIAGDVVVISVAGEIDLASAGELRRALRLSLAEHPSAVVFDLGRVTFADASLVHAMESLLHRSRRVAVIDVSPQARRLLSICGLERLCDAEPPPGYDVVHDRFRSGATASPCGRDG